MNGSSGELAKAKINVLEGKLKNKSIECMFRPKEYTITKQNSWAQGETIALDLPPQKFSGGGPSIMTMELFFDTYESGGDVRKYTNKIWELMAIDPTIIEEINNPKGRPPKVEFEWGKQVKSFKAVITNITQKFTMFKTDGTPVRTTLEVTFQEVETLGKHPFQNPTTGSKPGYKVRIIKEGDSLDWIAQEEYGNPALWRFIADTNNLENPMKLSPGEALSIAPAP